MKLFFKNKSNSKKYEERINLKITHNVLKLILECARETHPKEFAALLKCDKKKLITEITLLPGTISSTTGALFRLYMMPVDFTIIGTAHSHPTENFHPSYDDIQFFSNFGGVHIIVCYPYSQNSWCAYNRNGKMISLELVD